jgi:hypothetical protein
MKKAILIAAGTVTGLGAVLSITPPALSGSVSEIGMPSADPVAQATPAAQPTASATAKRHRRQRRLQSQRNLQRRLQR